MIASATSPFRSVAQAPVLALENLFKKRASGETVVLDTSEWFEDYQFFGANKEFRDEWYSNPTQHSMLLAGPAETGKTLACLALLHEVCLENPGVEALMLRKVRRHCYNTVCRSMFKIWPSDWEKKGYIVYGGVNSPEIFIWPNGSRCYVGGLDSMTQSETIGGVNALLSGEFDVVYVNQAEELARVDIDKISTRCTGRAGNLAGPRLAGLIMDANPGGANHPLLELEREGILKMFKSKHEDNPDLFDQETGEPTERGRLTLKILKSQRGVLLERLFYGRWTGVSGAYFASFDPQIHGIRESDFQLGLEWDVWVSMDAGYAHPNVILLHCQTGTGEMITFQEIVSIRQRPKHIAPIFHAVLAKWGLTVDSPQFMGFYAGTDAWKLTGVSKNSLADQYQKLELSMTQADMSPGSRVKSAHHLLDLLGNPDKDEQPTWFFVRETCPRLEETIPLLTPDPKQPEDVLKVDANSEGEGGDDTYDALRYGFRDMGDGSSMSNLKSKLAKIKKERGY